MLQFGTKGTLVKAAVREVSIEVLSLEGTYPGIVQLLCELCSCGSKERGIRVLIGPPGLMSLVTALIR
jgi:hypothetical protein